MVASAILVSYNLLMLVNIFVSVVGILFFLFIFWKRLIDDYLPSQIFTTAFFILLGVGFGYLISIKFLPFWWFWIGFLGLFLGLILGIVRYRLRFFETLEAVLIGFGPWLGLIFFADSVLSYSASSFIGFAVILGLVGLFYYLDNHYKGFTWYGSGRVGFAGLSVAAFFFTIRLTTSYFFSTVLSLSGKYDIWLSSVTAFCLFLSVFHLSRSNI